MADKIKSQIQNLNIVVGCNIGCSYCYARNNVRRFHEISDFECPEFFESKLRIMERKQPRNFLLTGMSDLAGWKDEWRQKIFTCMEENPQHNYIFLTKRPELLKIKTDMDSAWFGTSVTSSKEKYRIQEIRKTVTAKHYHATFEPMFDDIGEVDLTGIEWIVIGTETGKRKGKSDSKPEWVRNLTSQAHALHIPVFMKEDLVPIMGEENMIQELPEAFLKVLEEQRKW